jgi:hypothetical protein
VDRLYRDLIYKMKNVQNVVRNELTEMSRSFKDIYKLTREEKFKKYSKNIDTELNSNPDLTKIYRRMTKIIETEIKEFTEEFKMIMNEIEEMDKTKIEKITLQLNDILKDININGLNKLVMFYKNVEVVKNDLLKIYKPKEYGKKIEEKIENVRTKLELFLKELEKYQGEEISEINKYITDTLKNIDDMIINHYKGVDVELEKILDKYEMYSDKVSVYRESIKIIQVPISSFIGKLDMLLNTIEYKE